jgi:hypothetical protein
MVSAMAAHFARAFSAALVVVAWQTATAQDGVAAGTSSVVTRPGRIVVAVCGPNQALVKITGIEGARLRTDWRYRCKGGKERGWQEGTATIAPGADLRAGDFAFRWRTVGEDGVELALPHEPQPLVSLGCSMSATSHASFNDVNPSGDGLEWVTNAPSPPYPYPEFSPADTVQWRAGQSKAWETEAEVSELKLFDPAPGHEHTYAERPGSVDFHLEKTTVRKGEPIPVTVYMEVCTDEHSFSVEVRREGRTLRLAPLVHRELGRTYRLGAGLACGKFELKGLEPGVYDVRMIGSPRPEHPGTRWIRPVITAQVTVEEK